MTETRRSALKMLGAIGATCAFPFAGDELYGQEEHGMLPVDAQAEPYSPMFLTAAEYLTVSRLIDLIVPASDTPGAVEAGAAEYVDRVLTRNVAQQQLARSGIALRGGSS
jgi:gluconate 2-dehydrogenase gamma chain